MKFTGRYSVAAITLGAGLMLGGLAVQIIGDRTPVRVAEAAGLPARVSFDEGFAPMIQNVLPAVVNIASSRIVQKEGLAPFLSDPRLKQFFGKDFSLQFGMPREQHERSLGSGVIFSRDGYIVTNNHVVEKATDVRIFQANQREYKARVIGTDPRTDIAVLKVDATNLPVMSIADSSKVRIGEFVLAVGDPFGVGQTVTMGIVSATGRGGFGIEDIEDFIQTDAAVNPGNSGGALVNVRGELIGINTAILSESGGNQGIGFAIPVNMARAVVEQIMKTGRIVRGWLGIVIQPVTPTAAKAFGLPGEPRGGLIADVAPNGPAAHAGIQRGDIVLDVNGQPIHDSRDLQLKLNTMAPGSQATMKLFRNGSETEVHATLGEAPGQKPAPIESHPGSAATLDGIGVRNLTPSLAREIGVPSSTQGVVIIDVRTDSFGADAGLQRGDVIEEVNRKPVKDAAGFETAARLAGKEPALLLINRAGNTLFVVVEPI
jgi:serine protease Do